MPALRMKLTRAVETGNVKKEEKNTFVIVIRVSQVAFAI